MKITLDMWIQDAMLDTTQDGRCTAISCVHRVGSSDDEVYAIKFGDGAGFDSKQLAEIFLRKAQSAVNDQPNVQRFYLYAFYGGRKEHQGKHGFNIDGGSTIGMGETEPATKEGQLGQAMRMTEAGFQFFHRQSIELFRMTLEDRHESRVVNRDLMQENRELFTVFKEMLVNQATANHANRLAELAAETTKRDREFLYQIGPGIINEITGKQVLPQATADTGMLEALIETLDEEAILVLQKKTPPLLWAAVSARASEHIKKKNAAVEAASSALVTRRDPVVDNDESAKKDAAE